MRRSLSARRQALRRDALRPVSSLGFTLIELLVVIAVIGVLVALLLPAIQAAREGARRTSCANNLRQIGIGMLDYHNANSQFPIGLLDRRTVANPTGRQLAWSLFLLPFVEQRTIYKSFNTSLAYDAAANRAAASQIVPNFLCPSTAHLGAYRVGPLTGGMSGQPLSTATDWMATIDYGGMFGWDGASPAYPFMNGVMIWELPTTIPQISGGTSHVILVAEDTGRDWTMDGQWANGMNIFDTTGPINSVQFNEIWSDHPGARRCCSATARCISRPPRPPPPCSPRFAIAAAAIRAGWEGIDRA